MTPINNQAIDQARKLIAREYGNLSDLPEEVRNTLVNVYYEFCYMSSERKSKFAFPTIFKLAGNLLDGAEQHFKESAHLQASINNMPQIIGGLRSMSPDEEGYDLVVEVFLDIFKYKIDDADKKSFEQLRAERPKYKAGVREIPNLWRLL